MKKVFSAALVVLSFAFFATASAQEKDTTLGQKIKGGVKTTGKAIGTGAKAVGTGAKAVGNKTAEVASKGASKVVDKTYKGKAGPNGETIYIDQKSKYYWVDKTGHRHYVPASQLKEKTD